MKLFVVILLFLSHPLSFAIYTQVEKNIKSTLVARIAHFLFNDLESFSKQILEAESSEYLGLFDEKRCAQETSINQQYLMNRVYANKTDIDSINNYLLQLSHKKAIELSNDFKSDIGSLIDAFNTSQGEKIGEASRIVLPEYFEITDIPDKKTEMKFDQHLVELSPLPPPPYTPADSSKNKRKSGFLAFLKRIGFLKRKFSDDFRTPLLPIYSEEQ